MLPRTIVEKILGDHTILSESGRLLLYVDRIVAADTAFPALNTIKGDGQGIHRPKQAMLIPDHFTPSAGLGMADVVTTQLRDVIQETSIMAEQLGIEVLAMDDPRRGIQHVVATEQGFAQPGFIVVASDSHTSTQGAIGALAFSISADIAHALATQCVWFKQPKLMRIELEGTLSRGVTAKDVVLALIGKIGAKGADGAAIEYAGPFVNSLSMDGRMTICNMSVEMGGRLGIMAPDDVAIEYLNGRPYAPKRKIWDQAVAFWKSLPSDPGAHYDRVVNFNVSEVTPMVSWGNNTENVVSITGVVPDPSAERDIDRRLEMEKSLEYMGLKPGTPMTDIAIDQVFIGSCTNARIEDLREAANLLRGRKVVVPTLIVPGSGLIKAQAAAEGLDEVFISAGATWGEAGCSMCSAMNGDTVPSGSRCASTSNRNHVGRQGRGSRTHLLSPPMAAAAALLGRLADVRKLGDS